MKRMEMSRREKESAGLIGLAFVVALTAVTVATSCEPDGTTASTVAARCDCAPGDLVVTELMINPAGEDDGLEYVEVMNVSDKAVVLEGLVVISGSELRPEVAPVTGWNSPAIGPGERIVLSEAPPAAGSSNVSVNSMVLPNAAGGLAVVCESVEIDSVRWGESPTAPEEGKALQMAPVADRTGPRIWCASEDVADEAGNSGSPGKPNHECRSAASCFDQSASVNRQPVRPVSNDLVVTEVFANPEGPDSLENEWIEILALADFDLAGLSITHFNGPDDQSASRTFKIPEGDCHPVKVGDVIVIGSVNGIGLEGTSTFYNATGGVGMIRIADRSDKVVATARHPKVPDGASVSLKTAIASSGAAAVTADDDPASWVTTRCGNGLAATPGTLDVQCPRKK